MTTPHASWATCETLVWMAFISGIVIGWVAHSSWSRDR